MSDLSSMGIDPNVEESNGGFVLVPEGPYKAVIVKDYVCPTKDNTGRLLELHVQIIEGPHQGTVIKDRINIVNKSAQAQAIGQGQLKRICGLTGCPFPPTDTTLLYGKPLTITVKHEEFLSNKTGDELNSHKISNYSAVVNAVPAPGKAPAGKW